MWSSFSWSAVAAFPVGFLRALLRGQGNPCGRGINTAGARMSCALRCRSAMIRRTDPLLASLARDRLDSSEE
jgi:hypothetical protein